MILLNVPYSQKDDAKKLGAKWGTEHKSWFITDDMHKEDFRRWLPNEIENLKAEYFYLAKSKANCSKCNEVVDIAAIVLPENFESADDETSEQPDNFTTNDYSAILSYVSYVSPKALLEIKNKIDNYNLHYSKTIDDWYFAAACKSYGVIKGDYYIIEDHNAPFSPARVDDFTLIIFDKISVPISLYASS